MAVGTSAGELRELTGDEAGRAATGTEDAPAAAEASPSAADTSAAASDAPATENTES